MASIVVSTWLNRRGWIMIPVTVCGWWRGDFVLNTIATSSVSAGTATALDALQCLTRSAGGSHLLRGLTIGEARLPDLPVRVSPAATLTHVEGMLGLDFLRQFTSLRFDVPAGTLTLVLP
jgi:hypothetical protein